MTEDELLLVNANKMQNKIEESGISMITVKSNNSDVIAAINRVYGTNTNEITFEMFKNSIRNLHRAGIINGVSNG